MGIFDDKDSKKKIQFLEDERKKIWDRLVKLENENSDLRTQIIEKASESQKEASQSSRKAAEFRNKTEQRLSEATEKLGVIEAKLDEAERMVSSISEAHTNSIELKTKSEQTEADFQNSFSELKEKVDHLTTFMEDYPELDEKLSEVSTFISTIEENLTKSKTSLTSFNTRKKEIDEYYQEIFGYEDTDEDGEPIEIEGKKSELESAYDDLEEKVGKASARVTLINTDYEEKYKVFEENHRSKYDQINAEISSLLPNALTAGLSAAFSTKKEDEVTGSEKLQKWFNLGIYMLVVVSFIPFFASVFFLHQGQSLEDVLLKIPRLVLAIVPMYIPVLWFTYSANKKLNLSKRLIEEYAHKEVLSKTYEGISKQIENLNNDEQTMELRYRLLSNFLQVTSENPGKLISNYEASDHPVMEALEQSYKFQLAIDKLEGIPGLGKVAAILEANSKKKLEEKAETINRALSNKRVLEEEEEEEDV